MKEENAETTYLLEFENGKRRKITVPSNWKVTFGPAVKGREHMSRDGGPKIPTAIRFYENEKQQKAIFTDVVGFRDMSIKIQEEVIDTTEKAGFYEVEGQRKHTTFQATTKSWVDPDQDTASKTQMLLPSDTEIFDLKEQKNDEMRKEERPKRERRG